VENRPEADTTGTIERMLRLDPAFPPLWRSVTTLQFGVDAVAVLEGPSPWQLRLIRELERGVPEASLDPLAIALGAPENAAADFVRGIARALSSTQPQSRVTLQSPEGFPRERLEVVAESLCMIGVEVRETTWFGAPDESVDARETVIVLAHHLVEPRRVAALMSADIAHVPLVFTGSAAEVGPVVLPGETPCLACIAAHRRDADPAWPQLAAQLIGRASPPVSRALMIEAAFATAGLVSACERDRPRLHGHSLILREGSLQRRLHAHRPHAECRCRSLAESATAVVPAFRATTTASALARPA
jgi:bacteriocin biosynthesis cyclodehydratase domain-containing protein